MLHECQLALLRQGIADMSGISLRAPLLLNQWAASQLGARGLYAESKVPTLFSTMWEAGARGWMGGHPACSERAVAARTEELPGCPGPERPHRQHFWGRSPLNAQCGAQPHVCRAQGHKCFARVGNFPESPGGISGCNQVYFIQVAWLSVGAPSWVRPISRCGFPWSAGVSYARH